MKKKEVIYYGGQAFMGANHRCELIQNNKGLVAITDERPFFEDNRTIELQPKDIEIFWEAMERIKVYQWDKNYNSNACDGYCYEIKLRNPEGKSKYCNGHLNYPENFEDFLAALNKLFRVKIIL